jgi:dTDP-4-amino-4,6-dideoxygalactose transaminase
VSLPVERSGYRHIYNQFVIRAPRRDELRAFLSEQGIGTEIYYPVSLHEQACFAFLEHASEDFPESSRAAAETLALPIYPELESAEREYVVGRIAAFYGLG